MVILPRSPQSNTCSCLRAALPWGATRFIRTTRPNIRQGFTAGLRARSINDGWCGVILHFSSSLQFLRKRFYSRNVAGHQRRSWEQPVSAPLGGAGSNCPVARSICRPNRRGIRRLSEIPWPIAALSRAVCPFVDPSGELVGSVGIIDPSPIESEKLTSPSGEFTTEHPQHWHLRLQQLLREVAGQCSVERLLE